MLVIRYEDLVHQPREYFNLILEKFDLEFSNAMADSRNYKDGKGDGLCENWYEDGQKESEGHFKDGKPDGSWTYWHENGKRSEMHFKDGKPDDL